MRSALLVLALWLVACSGGAARDAAPDDAFDAAFESAPDAIAWPDEASTEPGDAPEERTEDPGPGSDLAGPEGTPDADSDLATGDDLTTPDVLSDVPADLPTGDEGGPAPTGCRANTDCGVDEVCEFSLGECQRRSTWTDPAVALYGLHPTAGAPGDVLIVDGARFYSNLMQTPTVKVGAVTVSGWSLETDENRALVTVTAAMSGAVTVVDPQGKAATLATPFTQTATGVLACDGTTPAASGLPGAAPDQMGPHAAGYVDLGDALVTRVFYPAACGSIRRPALAGTWPLVAILHGNGAVHLDWEYLGQLLASWGFVAFMPRTQQNMAGEPFEAMLAELMPLVHRLRGASLADLHPALAGVSTTPQIAFVGHSRGCGRAQEVIGDDADVRANTVAVVFLGPVDDGDQVPGLFLVFGGGKDSQSTPANTNGAYDRQVAPRWKVWLAGGNHGSFSDHKVYGYGFMAAFGDQQPTVRRPRQLTIVQSFVVPLFQRAFGLAEPFADQLDAPPAASDYQVTFDVGS